MALTNADSTKLNETIISDVNANIPAGNPDAVRHISPEAAILFNKAIVARPLMVPEVCSLRIKNSDYRYRWVNRDGLGGRLYTQRKAQGFTNATNDDVDVLAGDASAKDGEIRAGDLILMKIQVERYDAAIKSNMVKANVLANARGMYMEGASSDVNSDVTPNRRTISADPGARTGMAAAFIPANADAIINESISSGRVEETRAVVDGLRNKEK